MPKPLPDLTLASAVPPDRTRLYFEECLQYPFSPKTTECNLANAWWLAEASLAAYETFGETGRPQIDLSPLLEAGYRVTPLTKSSTQFLAIENAEVIIISFRGTRLDDLVIPFLKNAGFLPNWADVLTDARFLPTVVMPGILVHAGFMAAYTAIEAELAALLEQDSAQPRPVWFCGHSLGGALAAIAAYRNPARTRGLYTFGSPRVGNAGFAEALTTSVPNHCRFVHNRDIVTQAPPEGFSTLSGYTHAGRLKYISGQNTWTIEDGGRAQNHLAAIAKDAAAYASSVVATMKQSFSFTDPRTWPITFEAIADHSPLYYANKLFNAHEEAVNRGQ